jgi:hemerythrin superfamily protein
MASSDFRVEEDIITKIIKDHTLVRTLWNDYKSSNDIDFKKTCLDNIIKNIVQHSAAEEMALYGEYSKLFSSCEEGKNIASQSWKEHEDVKKLLYEIDQLSNLSKNTIDENCKLNELLLQLFTMLEHHMHLEEDQYLPKLKLEVDNNKLIDLGKSFDNYKLTAAPTRPHPMAPDKGITGILSNISAKPIDEARDALAGKRVM